MRCINTSLWHPQVLIVRIVRHHQPDIISCFCFVTLTRIIIHPESLAPYYRAVHTHFAVDSMPTHFFAFFSELFEPAHSFCLFLSFRKSLEEFRLFFSLFVTVSGNRIRSTCFEWIRLCSWKTLTFAVNNWGEFRYFIHLIENMARRHIWFHNRLLRAGTIFVETSLALHADGRIQMECESASCDEQNLFRLPNIHYSISRSLVQCVRLYFSCVADDALKTHIMFRYSAPQKYLHLWLPSIYRHIVVERGVGTARLRVLCHRDRSKGEIERRKGNTWRAKSTRRYEKSTPFVCLLWLGILMPVATQCAHRTQTQHLLCLLLFPHWQRNSRHFRYLFQLYSMSFSSP